MTAAAHQPLFLPWIGYFHKIDCADVFVIADNVQFTTTGWITRNRIKTPNGTAYLKIPTKSRQSMTQLINEIQVADGEEVWKRIHLKTITMNYSKTPFFKEIYNIIFYIYQRKWTYVNDLDVELIKSICSYLEIDTKILIGSKLGIQGRKNDLILDICRKTSSDKFIIGQGESSRYTDFELLEKNNIESIPQNFIHPEYRQRYGEFVPNLSVIDLLFNFGKRSIELIRNPLNIYQV